MKLRRQFSLVVVGAILLVILLTFGNIISSKYTLKVKDYQLRQIKVQSELAELINSLDQLDNWGFNTNNAYRDWSELVESLETNFNYLINDSISNSFPKDFKSNLQETQTLWNLLKERFGPIEKNLKIIESKKLAVSVYTTTEKEGVRIAAQKMPKEKVVQELLVCINEIHEQISHVRRCYRSLNNVTHKTEVALEGIITGRENFILILSIGMTLVVSVLLGVLIFALTTKVAGRIVKVRNISQILSEKNFTPSLKPEGSDEMRSLMININNMIQEVNDFFNTVKQSANKAIDSGYLISESSEIIAEATGEINQNLENIELQFHEISEAVERSMNYIAEMDVQVDTLVENNQRQAEAISSSNLSVNEVVNTLEYINRMAEERTEGAEEMHLLVADGDKKISATCHVLKEVTQKLGEVNGVIEIINNVAKRTNLLSMNAAIESAHAGEAGKGFAVVAGEIRKLSDATAANAEKIETVIHSIVASVTEANRSSEEASSAFGKVSTHADMVVASLREITNGVGRIDEQMHQIKVNSEQTSDAAEIISNHCGDLVKKQAQVSDEVDSVNSEFQKAMVSIAHIKEGAGSIVNKMTDVTSASEENSKNMTDLETVLDGFKTRVDENLKLSEEIEENQNQKDDSTENSSIKEMVTEDNTEETKADDVIAEAAVLEEENDSAVENTESSEKPVEEKNNSEFEEIISLDDFV